MIKEIPILFSTPIKELWKDIPDYEGVYVVSNDGRVKSIARSGVGSQGRVIKPQLNNCGYVTVLLSKNNQRERHLLHRIIAKCFIPNLFKKPHVNHKDGNKCNNSLSNLEWVTMSENVRHAVDTGLKKNFGIGIPLTDAHKTNLSISLKGRKSPCGFRGKKHTEESKLKARENNLGRSRNKGQIAYQYPVVQKDKDGVIIKEWDSATAAARALGVNQGNINSCLKGRKFSAGGFQWLYK